MDAAGIVTGAVIALVSGIVIPFLTTQFSLWSERRRETQRARRSAFDRFLVADQEPRERYAKALSASLLKEPGARSGDSLDNYVTAELETARRLMMSQFTTTDRRVRLVFDKWSPSDSQNLTTDSRAMEVVATWAAGRGIRASWAAWCFLRQSGKTTKTPANTTSPTSPTPSPTPIEGQ